MFDYLLIFLFSSDFVLVGYLFLLAALIIVIFRRGSVCFPPDFWILELFALSYFTINMMQNHSITISVLMCPLAYLLGANLDQSEGINSIHKTMLVLAVGMASHGILNFLYETVKCGGINYSALHYDIWSRSISSVTGQMTNYVFLLSFVGCTVLFAKAYWKIALILSISLIHGVICGSRTYVVMFGISFGISILIYILYRREKRLRSILILLLASFAAALILWTAYQKDWLGIRSFFENTYLYHRLFSDYAKANNKGLFTTGRWATKLRYLAMLPDYPMGGLHMRSITSWYAHDLWLDIADRVGIFPAMLIIIYTLRMGIRTFRLSINGSLNLEHKIIYFNYLVLIMSQFILEPILSSSPILLQSVCILDGMISVYLLQMRSGKTIPPELRQMNSVVREGSGT